MAVLTEKPSTAPSRVGAAPNTVNGTAGAPANDAVTGAEAQLRRDPVAQAQIHRGAELRPEDRAQRTRGLLRHAEVERLRPGLGEAVLRRHRAL